MDGKKLFHALVVGGSLLTVGANAASAVPSSKRSKSTLQPGASAAESGTSEGFLCCWSVSNGLAARETERDGFFCCWSKSAC